MLILQESCTDLSGALVVYAPVDLPAINIAMSGEDPSYIPLLPSGFTISPDGRPDNSSMGASSSSNLQGVVARSAGSLITVAFQILVSSLPSAKLNHESVTTINNLISATVQQIKAALNCPWEEKKGSKALSLTLTHQIRRTESSCCLHSSESLQVGGVFGWLALNASIKSCSCSFLLPPQFMTPKDFLQRKDANRISPTFSH